MYCSKCGAAMGDGAAFCSSCGQSFSASVIASSAPVVAAAGVPAYAAIPAYATTLRVQYAGFWLRVLAYLIDSVVMSIGFIAIVIPLIFLTGLGGFLSRFNPDEEWNDANFFLIIGAIFLAATLSLVVTWLYHALLESSEWEGTVGKKLLGMVVTDMTGRRITFARATGRHFAKILTNLVSCGFGLGYLLAAFTEKKQALHDMVAGCLVLRRG